MISALISDRLLLFSSVCNFAVTVGIDSGSCDLIFGT